MKPYAWTFYALFIVLLATFSTAQTIDIVPDSLALTITQGATKTATVTVKNLDTVNPLSIAITHDLDLVDNDNDKIKLSFSNPSPIPPNNSGTVTITMDADAKVDFETYQGIVTITDTNNTNNKATFDLSITVEPSICDAGETGNDLELEIDDPDDGEEFEPGDTVNIQVTVKNVGDDDIRTQVGAFLFSDKSQITNAASETKNIENGDEEEFELTMKIPFDSTKIDDDDDFTLFVKAFDDDSEETNCIEESVGVTIELPTHKVVINKGDTQFLPSSVSCGDTALANIHVTNIGEKDNDAVTIYLSNKELGITKQSDIFSIEAFSSEEQNDETRQFSVTIPDDAISKTYLFTVAMNYKGGSTSEQIPLQVLCESPQTLVSQGEVIATVTPVNTKIVTSQSSLITVPVKLQNAQPTKETFLVTLTNINELGVSAPKTITLNPSKQSTLFLELRVHDDVEPGIHTTVVEVLWEGTVIASETVAIEVEERIQPSPSALAALGQIFTFIPLAAWIIIDLIVIAVLIITVRTIVRNRKY